MATDTSTYKLNRIYRRDIPCSGSKTPSDPVSDVQLNPHPQVPIITINTKPKPVEFYKFLGLSQINHLDFPDNKFSLYFLAYDAPQSLSASNHWTDRSGVVELTHNYGTEDDPSYKVSNGNEEPHRGFGHLAISVDNIEVACQRLEDAGYAFQKKLTEGKMRHIAFVKDPDGYWVEIIRQGETDATTQTTDPSTYRMNHTMMRVKDAEASLKFYQEVMGMKLVRTHESAAGGFNLYFLGYPASNPPMKEGATNPIAQWEGLLELTWNYGTEKKEGKVYHDGNSEPQGFGHICVSVDDLDAACARFETQNVNWKKRLTDGRMKNVAFVLDPDGYWIEVIQNEKLKNRSHW
ncbi:lactoylglutathione lyase [Polytolypa hystricis UAMH7299]|uniref:lactoylglutathione lyase n=1 Tax=Polytolypa hystricis (strain UAMH7299) TaxID=1447883 RepID=A0A2B7WNP8_POLH7|nr:lactoylglutathione lyase [Polytolypa hystricis UAMH7299]